MKWFNLTGNILAFKRKVPCSLPNAVDRDFTWVIKHATTLYAKKKKKSHKGRKTQKEKKKNSENF